MNDVMWFLLGLTLGAGAMAVVWLFFLDGLLRKYRMHRR